MSQATQKATIAAAVLALAAVVAYMRRKRLLTTISSDGHACTQVPEAPNVHQMATSPKASPSSTSQPTQDATIAAATQSCETQSTEAEAPTRSSKGTEATALAAPDEPRQEAERTALSASNNSEKGKEPKAIAAPGKPPQEKTALAAQGTAKDETEATALAARVEDVLAKLRPTEAGSEARRVQALDLLSALRAATDLRSSKLQRRVARAFVDNEGPELVYAMESSMRGNWMVDAKNGTMRTLTAVSQLSGPIGKAMATYRAVAEKTLVDAAHGVGCEHTGAQPTAVAPRRGGGHP